MWCPPGYFSLHELSSIFDEAADMLLAHSEVLYSHLNEGLWDDGIPVDDRDDYRQMVKMVTGRSEVKRILAGVDLFQAWLVAATLDRLPVYACSPAGAILRVSGPIFRHSMELEKAKWDRHLSSPFLRDVLNELAIEGDSDTVFSGFTHFNYPSGVIWELSSLPADTRPCPTDVIRQLLGHFGGWAICFDEQDVPEGRDGVLTMLELSPKDFAPQVFETATDMPPRQVDPMQIIYDDVLRVYPNGKTASWAVVEEKTGYSRRSINRALKRLGGQGWRAQGGQKEG